MQRRPITIAATLLLLTILLTGCRNNLITRPQVDDPGAAPTVSAIFNSQQTTVPVLPPVQPTLQPLDPNANGTSIESRLETYVIYDDKLNSDWSTEHSLFLTVEPNNRRFVDEGRSSINAKLDDFTGSLFFTVNKGAKRTFLRENVVGIRFKISGGIDYISPDELGITVVGSNARGYWVDDDNSVQVEGRGTKDAPLFGDTRLYYLGVNQAIPPRTWIEITLLTEDLTYDPPYKYLTGFFLSAEKQNLDMFYIDQVELLLLPS